MHTEAMSRLFTRIRPTRILTRVVVLAVIAYAVLRVLPPAHIRIAAGPVGGSFYQAALDYKRIVERKGYRVDIVPFHNTDEIGARVADRSRHFDIGFVAGDPDGTHGDGLISLGQIQLQPIFLFENRRLAQAHPIHTFADMMGMTVVLPPERSVTNHALASVFTLSGIDRRNTHIEFLPLDQGIALLKQGRCDAGLFILGADSALMADLAKDPDLVMVPLEQQQALAKKLPYLTEVSLPAGIFDVARNVPAQAVPMLASTISVVARDDLPPATTYALLEAMREVHRGSSYVSGAGEFPRYDGLGDQADDRVDDFYRRGTPWIFSHLPPAVASVIDAYLTPLLAFWVLASAMATIVEFERVRRVALMTSARGALWWVRRRTRGGNTLSRPARGAIARLERAMEREDRSIDSMLHELREAMQMRAPAAQAKAGHVAEVEPAPLPQASGRIAHEMRRTYDQYFSNDGYRRRYPRPNAGTLDHLLSNGARTATRILDFGCGNGRYSLALLEHSHAQLTAYDISAASLAEFQRNLAGTALQDRVTLVHDDLAKLGAPASYDLILMLFGVLSHIGARAARIEMLARLRGLLRDDGRLILSVPSVYRRRPWELLKCALARRLRRAAAPQDEAGNIEFTRHVGGHRLTFFYHLYTLNELRTELAAAGFAVREFEAESVLPEWCVTQWNIVRRIDQCIAARIAPALGYGIRVLAVPV
ncbi:hypothetical protein LMG29739_03723 [Paraburkholderia solisilvae]|uniref:Methyltransferase type 12 domain-containing protein n=1 Tax=Paraburkholderia solisilvae TaxID=624376 RepID=A0A6J5E7D2_9BURK|nr:hypothetical protein LMG29739_03723 [Paraburkholderia solisilvae]